LLDTIPNLAWRLPPPTRTSSRLCRSWRRLASWPKRRMAG
jgi:hypothetical protein